MVFRFGSHLRWATVVATSALLAQTLQVLPASAVQTSSQTPTLSVSKSAIAWNQSTTVTTNSVGLHAALFVDAKFCADLGEASTKNATGESWNVSWGVNSFAYSCTKSTAGHIAQVKLYEGQSASAKTQFLAASKTIALAPAVAPDVKSVTVAPSAKFGSSVLEATVNGAVGTTGSIAWRIDGVVIKGATGAQYVLAQSDYGHAITAVVTVHTDGLVDAHAFSNAYTPIAPSNDDSLSSLTINGRDASQPGTIITVPAGTTSVDVKYTKSESHAKVWVLGADNLHDGNNLIRVVVVAQNGNSQIYTANVDVQSSSDTSLSKFNIVVDGQTLNALDLGNSRVVFIPAGTTAVQTQVVTNDPDAVALVVGSTGLVDGSNTLIVKVIAANGVSTQEYRVTLVASTEPTGIKRSALGDPVLSSDATLSAFKANGVDVTSGTVINLPNGSTSIDIVATPTDALATVNVLGENSLTTGSNLVTIEVTAEDGTIVSYTLTVNVDASSDATLFELSFDGVDVVDGQTVTAVPGTTAVDVFATPNDIAATVDVTGDTGLTPGLNTITVTVTAEDGVTVLTYTVYVDVQLSADTTLFELSVDGVDVVDGQTVTAAPGTDAVDVFATPSFATATVAVDGDTGLTPGLNTITVTVTAENGAIATYTVYVDVQLSADTTLFELSVDGADVVDGQTVTAAPGT